MSEEPGFLLTVSDAIEFDNVRVVQSCHHFNLSSEVFHDQVSGACGQSTWHLHCNLNQQQEVHKFAFLSHRYVHTQHVQVVPAMTTEVITLISMNESRMSADLAAHSCS